MKITINFCKLAKLAKKRVSASNGGGIGILELVDNELQGYLTIDDQKVIEIQYSSADDRARVLIELLSSIEALAAGFARGALKP